MTESACRVTKEVLKWPAEVLPFAENLSYEGRTIRLGVNDSRAYQYDAQGRISRVASAFSLDGERANYSIEFNHTPAAVHVTLFQAQSAAGYPQSVPLNGQGLITEYNGTIYTYNSDGYLISRTNGPTTTTYTVTNGNIVRSVETTATPNFTQVNTITYEYDLTRPFFGPALERPYFLLQLNEQPLAPYLGKTSKNLLIKRSIATVYTPVTGPVRTAANVIRFTYLYDERGVVKRIISDALASSDGVTDRSSLVSATDYTYACPQ